MFNKVLIEYANPRDISDVYTLSFNLRRHSVAETWANLVDIAIKKYSIDDPGRFYGFGSKQDQITRALDKINRTIDVINSYKPIVERKLVDILDQDTLNYLHHIFEVYHGLLDQQAHEFWQSAPVHVQKSLADLNIQVHECEVLGRSSFNRYSHITTWYNMPKLVKLSDDQYELFEDTAKAGTIYLLYTEIGKTLEDLSVDDDQYIHDTAFKPFRHMSADCHVKYYDDDTRQVEEKRAIIKQYYENNQEFFSKCKLPWGHPYLRSGAIPLADLDTVPKDLISNLESRQWIKTITLQ